MNDWHTRARALVACLAERGYLADPRWQAAFEAVPRHVFVPRFYLDDETLIDGDDPAQERKWLDAVYRDDALVTQLAAVPGTDLMWATSSSTMPSLMAYMLDLLDVQDGQRVLEIGTGTGYNAAILCHRLGDMNVASIDLHPDLVDSARGWLAQLGYWPCLAAGDGAEGMPDRAPFDRILATCAVPALPAAWISQLRTGGLVVTDLRGGISSSLAALRKIDLDTVEGHFLPAPGHFMWLRAQPGNPLRTGGDYGNVIDRDGAEQRMAALDPASLSNPDFRFLLQRHEPDLRSIWRTVRDGVELVCLTTDDGAWAEVETRPYAGQYTVTQGGPRRIWDRAERAADLWAELGRPARDRFGLTATPTRHDLWLDDDGRRLWIPPAEESERSV